MRLRSVGWMLVGIALVAAGCSGGGGGSAEPRFDVPTSSPAAGAPSVPAAARPKIAAEARMFAGTQSVLGQALRYCRRGGCSDQPARAPSSYLNAPSGAFVLFAVAEAPAEAVAEVRVGAKDQPATVHLSPSTLMVFNFGLGKGNYLVDLVVKWKDSDARWRFGLAVV